MANSKSLQSSAPRNVFALAAIYFFALGSALVWTYMPRYLDALGFSGLAIGTLLATRSVLQITFTPIWAGIADRWDVTRGLVRAQFAIGLIAACALPWFTSYTTVFAIICLYAINAKCAVPLVDAMTLREVGANAYGRVRAWGSIGFGALALTAAGGGLYFSHQELAFAAPWTLIVVGLGALVGAFVISNTESVHRRPEFKDMLSLCRRPVLLLALIVCAAHWASQSPYNLFLVFLCEEREFSAWVPGVAVLAGVTAEVLVLGIGARILKRITPFNLLFLCIFVTAIRWHMTAVVTHTALLILIQTMHGFSFGGFIVAIMAILGREVPSNLRATGQALFFLVVFGIGGGLGNFFSGWALDHVDPSRLFFGAGIFEMLVLLIFLPFLRGIHQRLWLPAPHRSDTL